MNKNEKVKVFALEEKQEKKMSFYDYPAVKKYGADLFQRDSSDLDSDYDNDQYSEDDI